MVEQLNHVLVVQLVHDLNLKLDLLNQVVLNDLSLVDDLDSVDIFRLLVAHFIHLSEATYADV